MTPDLKPILGWFQSRGWSPFDFQIEVWRAYLEGESGLIHSPTGTGKTLAGWFGPICQALSEPNPQPGLKVLWITPLRALAADTLVSLQAPAQDLGLGWRVEARTGDTSSSVRAKQRDELPDALVTTPESLSLLLTRKDHRKLLAGLQCVVVDEWHELLSTKRGVQTELCLARLRSICPDLRTWGISATLGNLTESLETLLGEGSGRLVSGNLDREIVIDTILPQTIHRFPWAGHFGTQMIPRVIKAIEESGTTLVFTNTRAQAEIWHQQILAERPDWRDLVALHHGSLSREVRDEVERGLKEGKLRAVICTSSLDLGVDFSPVERVLQVGSPKGVARLLQRAGRSGHQPGVPSRITCVPTHAFELVDMAGARKSALAGKVESREGVRKPLDVLAQHLVSCAMGGGFRAGDLLSEVRKTTSFGTLTDEEWGWTIDFVTRGGESLRAYPEFQRAVEVDGVFTVPNEEIAKRHRMSIGTIVSDAAMNVALVGGGFLGTIEESFLARLKPGDRFLFAGRPLEFVRIKDMTAYVRKASRSGNLVPRWAGGRLPLSNELSQAIREELELAKYGVIDSPEMEAVSPVLQRQAEWSAIPASDEFLVEQFQDREGYHLFFYPFEGRLVHEGLAALFATRLARLQPITFTLACNDYGFELLSTIPVDVPAALAAGLLSADNLGEDIVASLNAAELSKRQFREIARIAGLIFQGYPGMGKSAKQLQASSGLFYDVFARYEPGNLLLNQAQREVLERQLEQSRLVAALTRLQNSKLLHTFPPKPTPISFPILVDRLRETVSSETLSARLDRMLAELEEDQG